ncbi:phosphotransferase [Microbispora cellulosiformans]|uniref:Phosphotransferase n=2 Tax=Microbispora cellulosiformans TaxID=2614688 RepID=A0A5J5K953_9ACTN|nr:phosphotransferase [Microbispora cellulosiformans]
MRAWSLSAVERLHFPDGSTAIFKFAAEPFTGEDRALKLAAVHGVPVPELYACAVSGGVLGMLMQDLGEPVREAADDDGVKAAVVLHRVRPSEILPTTLDADKLRALPLRALAHLDYLRQVRRWKSTLDIAEMLSALDKVAPARAQGAELAPFGLCHSEFHPSSLHVGRSGWRLLDFARAFNGPGLLDLASWPGTQQAANVQRVRRLIEAYVAAGGPQEALAPRGGLSAEAWALGWHRVWIVEWFMDQTVHWINDPSSDPVYIKAVRRHLREAVRLLVR